MGVVVVGGELPEECAAQQYTQINVSVAWKGLLECRAIGKWWGEGDAAVEIIGLT